jgi:thioredoxin 1
MIYSILAFIKSHPAIVIFLLFIAYRQVSLHFARKVTVAGSRVNDIASAADLKKLLESNEIVILDFHADWCPGCVYAAPEFAKLSKVYTNVVFAKVNTDVCGDLAEEYGIQSLPTFKLILKSNVTETFVGFDRSGITVKLVAAGGVEERSKID